MQLAYNPAVFAAFYPSIATALPVGMTTPIDRGDGVLEAPIWTIASRYADNSDASPICDPVERQYLMNLMAAHVATLLLRTAAGGASGGLVGQINSVTEGSVSIGVASLPMMGGAAFYAQTPYGLQFWAATAKYRSLQYYPGRPIYAGVPGPRG